MRSFFGRTFVALAGILMLSSFATAQTAQSQQQPGSLKEVPRALLGNITLPTGRWRGRTSSQARSEWKHGPGRGPEPESRTQEEGGEAEYDAAGAKLFSANKPLGKFSPEDQRSNRAVM